jgi:DNA-binding CsgD family transcriptional regulator
MEGAITAARSIASRSPADSSTIGLTAFATRRPDFRRSPVIGPVSRGVVPRNTGTFSPAAPDRSAVATRGGSKVSRIGSDEGVAEQVLTAREEEVLKLVAEEHSSEEIAQVLFISAKTVERHRANMLHKLGPRDRLDLTRYAIRAGLIEP